MYKKLEETQKKILAKEEQPEEECRCTCGKTAEKNEKPSPEANFSLNSLTLNYELNG